MKETKKKKKKVYYKFTKDELKMLLDLQDILESFEYVFEKFQSNKITSSLVYPAICFLKNKLNDFSPKSTKVT